ncbi:hypothetical protein ACS0TY_016860 [Phlomoides rotata]
MDHSPVQSITSIEEDEWDTDGFVIPSLGIEDPDQNKIEYQKVEDPKVSKVQNICILFWKARKDENIYLGPHGAPPSQAKQQEQKSSSRKQKLKQKLRAIDSLYSGTGRENKMDHLRELVGGGKTPAISSKSSPRDWLDPHCHESEFERKNLH